MDRSYRFSVVRLAPGGARDERLNIGIAVFLEEGVRVHLPARLDKVRALSGAIDDAAVQSLADTIEMRDAEMVVSGISDVEARARVISDGGPIQLSSVGTFSSRSDAEFHARITSLLSTLVQPEPAPKHARAKRSRLLTDLKRSLRSERILAKPSEDIFSHRIVANFQLADGLVADLALKNGAMHIVETVDIATDESSSRRAIADIAVSALVLEQARMNFGDGGSKTRLVYNASSTVETAAKSCLDATEHQGAELYNWASTSDQQRLLATLSSLAVPIETAAQRKARLHRGEHPRFRSI